MCCLIVLLLLSTISFSSADSPSISNNQIHMDAESGNCAFHWYYDIDFFDAEGKVLNTYGHSRKEVNNRHNEAYDVPSAAATMTIKVGAHAGGSHTWTNVPAQAAAFLCKGWLASSAQVQYKFKNGGSGSYSLNAGNE